MFQLLRYAKDYRKQIILGPFFQIFRGHFRTDPAFIYGTFSR